jgi:glutathione S-transferase
VRIWDALAIGEYLAEAYPDAGLLPENPADRAHCRSICAEMHGGFTNLRAALPMNLRVRFENFKVYPGVRADIARIVAIWTECFERFPEGPYLFGARTMADAMYAPVAARFLTYGVDLDDRCRRYCDHLAAMPEMREWTEAARMEIDDFEELDAEF